jgi:hypothetical protein
MKKQTNITESAALSVLWPESKPATANAQPPGGAKSMRSKGSWDNCPDLIALGRSFGEAFQQWHQNAEKVAKQLVDFIDAAHARNLDAVTWLTNAYPNLGWRTINRLERIGRGLLLPTIAMDASTAAQRIESWCVKEQKALVDSGGIVTVVKKADTVTGYETTQKRFNELSNMETQIAIGHDGPVSVKEQMRRLSKPVELPRRFSFDAVTGVVTFYETRFALAELEDIVSKFKPAFVSAMAAHHNRKHT